MCSKLSHVVQPTTDKKEHLKAVAVENDGKHTTIFDKNLLS